MTVNVHRPEFDDDRDEPGFRARRARIGWALGTRDLGASLWELDPGEAAYPYHLHLGEEELVVVLAGSPSLRGPDGWRELEAGEVVAFPTGERGAHQIANRGEDIARFLAISAQSDVDVVLYPDSDKVSAAQRRPGSDGTLALDHPALFRLADRAGYFDDEAPPAW